MDNVRPRGQYSGSPLTMTLAMTTTLHSAPLDMSVPRPRRYRWPKRLPPLSPEQARIADDFVKYWHEILPSFRALESFNHRYPLRHLPGAAHWRTLELGAGIGGHLPFEPLERQDYHCIELREPMAEEIRRRFPMVKVTTCDCQRHIPHDDAFFDRVVAVHVLEHLPDLPSAVGEVFRVLKPGGFFSVVLPCDPGLAYEVARKVSAERIFRKRYGLPYRWLARREHINSPGEILHVLAQKFQIIDRSFFPLRVPLISLNLCIGVTARRPGPPSHKTRA
jgi:SAM-dependent methyltransferase